MTKKQNAEVLAAVKAENDARSAWDAAVLAEKQAAQAYCAARKAAREARVKADSALPQCSMVSVSWRSGNTQDAGRVVVLKITPSGTLVVRRVGDADGDYRFNFDKHTGRWTQAERTGYATSIRELRDVPAEFAPNG